MTPNEKLLNGLKSFERIAMEAIKGYSTNDPNSGFLMVHVTKLPEGDQIEGMMVGDEDMFAKIVAHELLRSCGPDEAKIQLFLNKLSKFLTFYDSSTNEKAMA